MANLTNNRLDTVATNQQISAAKTALQAISTNLPFLIGLTSEERKMLPAIDVSNKVFTEDAINAGTNNGDMLPNYIDTENIKNDLTLFQQLDELISITRQILEKLEDTQFLAGSEAYSSALMLYKLFGSAADGGVPGADSIVAQLRERFTSKGNTSPNPLQNPNL